MHLKQIPFLIAGVGRSAVPHLVSKDNHITRVTEDALFPGALPLRVTIWFTPGEMATGNKFRRTELFVHVAKIEMSGGNKSGDVHPRIFQYIRR